MSALMEQAGPMAHRRSITVSTYPLDDMNFIVEGRLVDERCKDYYLITGERRPAGEIHHMVIRWLVHAEDMTIKDYEVEMVSVPRDECDSTARGLSVIKGLKVGRGFSVKIRSLLGGIKGCTHIVTLLIEMAPAAIQGIWSSRAQRPFDLESGDTSRIRIDRISKMLANTCYVWRDDGPDLKRLKETVGRLLKKSNVGKGRND